MTTSSYLDVNIIHGGRRTGVPTDSYAIVEKGLKESFPGTGTQQLCTTVPVSEGYGQVVKKLREISKEKDIPIAPQALTP